MHAKAMKFLGAATVLAALTGAPALYAYAQPTNSQQSGGMMHGGQPGMMGQGGMMGMMGQMTEMMENCNKMMQSMHQDGSKQPHEGRGQGDPDNSGKSGSNG